MRRSYQNCSHLRKWKNQGGKDMFRGCQKKATHAKKKGKGFRSSLARHCHFTSHPEGRFSLLERERLPILEIGWSASQGSESREEGHPSDRKSYDASVKGKREKYQGGRGARKREPERGFPTVDEKIIAIEKSRRGTYVARFIKKRKTLSMLRSIFSSGPRELTTINGEKRREATKIKKFSSAERKQGLDAERSCSPGSIALLLRNGGKRH